MSKSSAEIGAAQAAQTAAAGAAVAFDMGKAGLKVLGTTATLPSLDPTDLPCAFVMRHILASLRPQKQVALNPNIFPGVLIFINKSLEDCEI